MNIASSFPKLKLKQFPQIQERETPESKFWKGFSLTREDNLQSAPTCINFHPVDIGSYIVTASTKVSYYDGVTDQVQRSYSRFTDDAYSGRFRKDGKLIVAGDKTGHLKVFDFQTKSVLRQLKGHSSAVRSTIWTCDGLHMLSGSDDKKIKLWDLGTQEVVWDSKSAHTDYVRTMDSSLNSPELFASGSYDHTVKLWDSRCDGAVASINHDQPVEKVLMSPSGTLLMSSSGCEIKVWDILSGCKLVHTFSCHQKNITALTYDGTSSRLLSCGLDGHVKIYNMQTMQLAHGLNCGKPLLSLALSQNNRKLLLGAVDGALIIRNRSNDDSQSNFSTGLISGQVDDEDAQGQVTWLDKPTTARARQPRKSAGGPVGTNTELIETERVKSLRPYEAHLKKFNYQMALDAALKTRNPLVVVTVLEELCRRCGLTVALSGRDDVTLEPLLAFLAKYVSHPRYSRLIVQITQRLLDLYASVLGHSDTIDELFLKIHRQIKTEVMFQRQVMKVMGALDTVISNAGMPPIPLSHAVNDIDNQSL